MPINNISNGKSESPPKRKKRGCLVILLVIPFLCILLIIISSVSNPFYPQEINHRKNLSSQDKQQLITAAYLRNQFGDSLWAGWGDANLPVMLYNPENVFLVGYPNPPAGWIKIPGEARQGGEWNQVPNDTVEGIPYFAQSIPDESRSPGAFTSRIGAEWVSSLPMEDQMVNSLAQDFKSSFPSFLQPIIPYQFASRLFLTSAGGRDWYVLGLLHESFHAFEGLKSEKHLTNAEVIYNENQDRYPWSDADFKADWQKELNLLADAVEAGSLADTATFAREFLIQRDARRQQADLDQNLIDLETGKEWEEGLAKYTELSMWRVISDSKDKDGGISQNTITDLLDKNSFSQHSSQQVAQIRRMADAKGDQRFYYSGFALAAILDKLNPSWRGQVFNDGTTLEGLLIIALDQMEK